ncbi:MAG: L,D-transpeptidase [Clostridia bacterium]
MKKQQIILIGIIIALIIAIIAVSVNIINSNKSKETYSKRIKDENSENNDILYVALENNLLNETLQQNELEENILEENIAIENNVNTSDNTNKSSNTGTTKYKLEVNCEQNVVNVYTKDENGEYTNCVKVMLCSVGPATPTSGTYTLKKYDGWEWKGLFGDVYGQYATQITGNILFHSVPYTEKYNNASLEYWEYDKLGTPASMGCVRLTVENAKWIYDNCSAGTKVKFYEDSNPGPLGKPSERKISSEIEYRNWDPTDPSSANPWRNYKNEDNSATDENLNTENTENTVNEDTKDNNIVTNNESTNTTVNNEEINSGNNTIKSNQTVNENVANTQGTSEKVTENTTNSEITNKESK